MQRNLLRDVDDPLCNAGMLDSQSMHDHRKQLADAIESSDSDRIVRALEEMTSEVHALCQTMSDFHQDMVHVLRNPPTGLPREQHQWTLGKSVIPESVSCEQCDAGMDSLAEALREGWTDLCRDDGTSWNYLGLCPQCQEAEAQKEQRMQGWHAATDAEQEEPRPPKNVRLLF